MSLPGNAVSAGASARRSESVLRFDRWAASYELSQLQTVLYGRVHDAVLRYARRHVPDPGTILDVGCGTGRLPARLVSSYGRAHVVGIDASAGMIRQAVTAPRHGARRHPGGGRHMPGAATPAHDRMGTAR